MPLRDIDHGVGQLGGGATDNLLELYAAQGVTIPASGGDVLQGSDDRDKHNGGDVFNGGTATEADLPDGGRNVDFLAGRGGDDRLIGGAGADTLEGSNIVLDLGGDNVVTVVAQTNLAAFDDNVSGY